MHAQTLPAKRPLFYFAAFLSFCTFLLLIAGGLVTSHEAGLAVPDWPLSYGQFFPPMVGNIFWEHGHRMIAGFVGLLTLAFVIVLHRAESRIWMRHLGTAMLAAVVFQAILGGLTVKLMLPPAVSIFHACLAQTFFCLTIAAAYFLSPGFIKAGLLAAGEDDKADAGFYRLLRFTTILVFIQLILGATVRHTGHGHAVVTHIVLAFLIALHIVLILVKSQRESSKEDVSIPILLLGILTVIQMGLGMGSFIFTRMIERAGHSPSVAEIYFTAAHQSGGALILGLCFWLTLRVRPIRQAQGRPEPLDSARDDGEPVEPLTKCVEGRR